MKKMKPDIGSLYDLPNPGLWAYFKHTVEGQSEDYRPPLFGKAKRSKVLQAWLHIVEASGIQNDYPGLMAYELEMMAKVGPMSIQKPLSERIGDIEAYYTGVRSPGEPISQAAITAAKDFFSKAGGITLRSKDKTLKNMKLSTNSGNPYFKKRKLVLHKPQGKYPYVATLGWRGQEGGPHEDDVKQRVIWMFSFLLNVDELRFYQPAVLAIQKNKLIPAYISMDAVDAEVTALFDSRESSDQIVICTDFTKFDQHFNKHLQNAAYEICKSLCTNPKDLDPATFFEKYSIPLVCSKDLMYMGDHGMGSGSGGTNFDECMAHKALQYEAAISAGQKLNPHSMAYGDDGILTFPGITVGHVTNVYTAKGLAMNEDKQYESDSDCVVLRRWHSTKYRVNGVMVGVYSTFRALGRLLGQERFYDPKKWGPKMVVLRSLSILENCKWHPLFYKLIDFVIDKGDRYRLGLSIPGFFDNLTNLAKEATEFYDDFMGFTKTQQSDLEGINEWEVVKYVKSKQNRK